MILTELDVPLISEWNVQLHIDDSSVPLSIEQTKE
jgi:hypothetical protein